MKAIARQRARVARVRRVQHLQAASIAAAAEAKVVQLESNATRLATLRGSLAAPLGPTSGAALGSTGELAARLDAVRSGVADALGAARVAAMERALDRRNAHIRREGAERLQTRAVAELHQMIEQRMTDAFGRSVRETKDD